MRPRTLLVALVAILVASSMLVLPSANAQGNSHQKWLFLLYLNADNSLDVNAGAHHLPVVQSDIKELTSVGSTKDVVPYALVDRVDGPGRLFKIQEGSVQEMTDWSLDGTEVDMGDPGTLTSFVQYTTTATPADHTLLIFWDHGSPSAVSYDDHASATGGSDQLTQWEVCAALSGYKVDVIGADECNVGQTEVAYEYAMGTQTEYLVAAETYTGWRGFPYDAILRELTAEPSMSPRDVAKMMIEQTQLLLDKPPYSGERVNSHAAIDLSKMPALASSLGQLTDLLMQDMQGNSGIISRASGLATYCYGSNAISLMDLQTFVEQIGAKAHSGDVRNAAAAVLENLQAAVIGLHATGSLDHMVGGMGIIFPNHSWEMPPYYENFAFASQGWLAFVQAYWAVHGSA